MSLDAEFRGMRDGTLAVLMAEIEDARDASELPPALQARAAAAEREHARRRALQNPNAFKDSLIADILEGAIRRNPSISIEELGALRWAALQQMRWM